MAYLERLFAIAHKDLRCNTSYPVFKELYQGYLNPEDLFSGVTDLSYYIHVPFCKHLCSFCEYTRFVASDPNKEREYLSALTRQISQFLETHDVHRIHGLDIGGGTPSVLHEDEFSALLDIADMLSTVPTSEDFEKSIEISFLTITKRKLEQISEHGFKRVSAGLQFMDKRLMHNSGREYSGMETLLSVRDAAESFGIDKFNVDLMYGVEHQSADSISNTLAVIRELLPQQVTLYEMRYNSFGRVPRGITRDSLYDQYANLYEGLLDLGYHAVFGQNAFSLGKNDDGVSSYLKKRMLDCMPYKGFGISAQSMSNKGISYGSLKGSCARVMPALPVLGEEYSYVLPGEELVGKYVSIALYGGCFKLSVITRLIGDDARSLFKEELELLEHRGCISIIEDIVTVTREGFKYYGAIAALFWSRSQQRELLRQHGLI